MRHRNPAQTAAFSHRSDALVIDEAEAVPQEIAGRRLHQEGALTDADRGFGPDPR
jgi:hypothetical protein